jgi:hypothetical protein
VARRFPSDIYDESQTARRVSPGRRVKLCPERLCPRHVCRSRPGTGFARGYGRFRYSRLNDLGVGQSSCQSAHLPVRKSVRYNRKSAGRRGDMFRDLRPVSSSATSRCLHRRSGRQMEYLQRQADAETGAPNHRDSKRPVGRDCAAWAERPRPLKSLHDLGCRSRTDAPASICLRLQAWCGTRRRVGRSNAIKHLRAVRTSIALVVRKQGGDRLALALSLELRDVSNRGNALGGFQSFSGIGGRGVRFFCARWPSVKRLFLLSVAVNRVFFSLESLLIVLNRSHMANMR